MYTTYCSYMMSLLGRVLKYVVSPTEVQPFYQQSLRIGDLNGRLNVDLIQARTYASRCGLQDFVDLRPAYQPWTWLASLGFFRVPHEEIVQGSGSGSENLVSVYQVQTLFEWIWTGCATLKFMLFEVLILSLVLLFVKLYLSLFLSFFFPSSFYVVITPTLAPLISSRSVPICPVNPHTRAICASSSHHYLEIGDTTSFSYTNTVQSGQCHYSSLNKSIVFTPPTGNTLIMINWY